MRLPRVGQSMPRVWRGVGVGVAIGLVLGLLLGRVLALPWGFVLALGWFGLVAGGFIGGMIRLGGSGVNDGASDSTD